jgi:hypothetical protein
MGCAECEPWVFGSKNLLLSVLPPAVAVVNRRLAASGRAHPHQVLPLLHLPANHTATRKKLKFDAAADQWQVVSSISDFQWVVNYLFLAVLNGTSVSSPRELGVAAASPASAADRFRPLSMSEEVIMPMDRSVTEKICEVRYLQMSCDPPTSCSSSCLASSLMWLSSVTTSSLLPPLRSTRLSIDLPCLLSQGMVKGPDQNVLLLKAARFLCRLDLEMGQVRERSQGAALI